VDFNNNQTQNRKDIHTGSEINSAFSSERFHSGFDLPTLILPTTLVHPFNDTTRNLAPTLQIKIPPKHADTYKTRLTFHEVFQYDIMATSSQGANRYRKFAPSSFISSIVTFFTS
jgi:hypothetical protein